MAYHGKAGSADFGGTGLVNITGWSLDTTAETAISTAFGETWESSNVGLTDFNVSAEGFSQIALDTDLILGTAGALVLGLNGAASHAFTANALLTSISETVGVNGNGKISYGFEGSDTGGMVYGAATGVGAAASGTSFHGKHCKAMKVDVTFTDFREWTVSMSCATADVTAVHATLSGRLRLAGFKSATASVTCLAAGADLQFTLGESAVLNFHRTQTAANGVYSGTFLCTGWNLGVNTGGEETITYNFVAITAVTCTVV